MTTSQLTVPGLLEKLAARQAAAEAKITRLREQIDKLTDALAAAEHERARWTNARETVLALAGEEQLEPATLTRSPVTPAYPLIIGVFNQADGALRVKQVCQALGAETDARHIEGMRPKLKKLVARGILTEPEPGIFALAKAPATASSAS